ncbi:hypothetical protein ACJIZ3_023769 [Penstemon smallii]|uniref:Uncharacterized protein n=1 Tax=Penstemon smallii TaxID=265156 RepID=A0ABD3TT17_9LAMI
MIEITQEIIWFEVNYDHNLSITIHVNIIYISSTPTRTSSHMPPPMHPTPSPTPIHLLPYSSPPSIDVIIIFTVVEAVGN